MKIQKDKLLHFAVGVIISAAVGIVVDPITGVIVAFFAGLAKEAYDDISGSGNVDIMDAVATLSGGVMAGGIVWML